MKNFRFTYYGRAITKAQFEKEAPTDWQEKLNDNYEFVWGGYKAILID